MSRVTARTVEGWIAACLQGTDLRARIDPGVTPSRWADQGEPLDLRPTRPPGLEVASRTSRSVKARGLRNVAARVRLLHTFCHHEVQAAELFGWAILRFPRAEAEFRTGLLGLLHDELRHARLYAAELEKHGASYGDHPVRDWFWERVPQCETPLAFVSLVGLGLEGGNLEHAQRFAAAFREVGDESGARVQERIAREEEAHARFAVHWFERWSGELDFEAWREQLPGPISPMLLKGTPLAREARRRAGFDEGFLDALEAWPCRPSGS